MGAQHRQLHHARTQGGAWTSAGDVSALWICLERSDNTCRTMPSLICSKFAATRNRFEWAAEVTALLLCICKLFEVKISEWLLWFKMILRRQINSTMLLFSCFEKMRKRIRRIFLTTRLKSIIPVHTNNVHLPCEPYYLFIPSINRIIGLFW